MKRLILVVSIVSVISACDRRTSPIPSAPSPVPAPAPQPAPAPVMRTLSGYIYDTAFRPVAGARIEILDGPQAGTATTSTASGTFSYDGTFSIPVTLRGTKEGYTVGLETARALTDGRGYASFLLTSLAPPVPVAGNYTLTITADPACVAFPDDLRTRSFAATVTAGGNSRAPANTSFTGYVTGAQFAPYANTFWIGVSGDYVAISTAGEGPSLVEQVGPNKYVAFWGEASLSVGPAGVSTISAPFKGSIEYCELKSAVGSYYDCSVALAVLRDECTLNNSQLTLTRR